MSGAEGRGREDGCPTPSVMPFFFFFFFGPFESCMVSINKETFWFESVLVGH